MFRSIRPLCQNGIALRRVAIRRQREVLFDSRRDMKIPMSVNPTENIPVSFRHKTTSPTTTVTTMGHRPKSDGQYTTVWTLPQGS